jgi:septal ring factor EnvC (AmiA/AmiB activator)
MTQDLTQWITEVRTLQHQLADARRERDQAHNSAANWRRLYDNEARQRRQEAEQFEAQIDALQSASPEQPDVEQVHDLGASSALQVMQQQIEALTQQLEAERKAHAHTRQSLTAALGDTFDMLKVAPSASSKSAEIQLASRR